MIYRFGDCQLDDQRYELRRDGQPRHLEPQVFWRSRPGTAPGRRSCGRPSACAACRTGRRPRGRATLRRLYDQFDEGFGTPDLLAARALLDR
jgi:hypothetical protein